MNEFLAYTHVERYGNDEVVGIELGELVIFPKLDGTNASTWLVCGEDGGRRIAAGSRTRELSLEADNAGFYAAVLGPSEFSERLAAFHHRNPDLRLYGEWLVPHTLKTYRDDAWRRFWIFDVYNDRTNTYLHYDQYKLLLDECQLDYIPPLARIKGGDYEYFLHVLKQNVFFIKDGAGIGEGIVLKNYNFLNKYNKYAVAKIVNNEFKEMHYREMGAPSTERKVIEEEFAKQYVTETLCQKTYAKIATEKDGWSSRYIPELLGRVYHDLVTEELWGFLKHTPSATLNFGTLRHYSIAQTKHHLAHLF